MAIRKRSWTNKTGKTNTCWEYDFKDAFGERIVKGGFKTRAEAEAAHAETVVGSNNGILLCQDKHITFDMAANMYMNLHAEIYCKQSTIVTFKSYLRKHLLPCFGNLKVMEITPMLLKQFMQIKLKEGLSFKTVNNCLAIISVIIQKMVDDGIVGQNPVKKVKNLKLPKKEMKFLELTEIDKILEAAKLYCPNTHALLATAIMTGARKGELLALTWNDIDLEARKISITKTLFRKSTDSPKTKTSNRRIDIPVKLAEILQEWKPNCPKGNKNLVFPNTKGEYADAGNTHRYKFKKVLKVAGVKDIRFHDLRHTFASLLISKDAPIKYTQSQMGHSSIQITLDVYGHLMEEANQKGIEALNSIL